jgi:hypothetical protein
MDVNINLIGISYCPIIVPGAASILQCLLRFSKILLALTVSRTLKANGLWTILSNIDLSPYVRRS